MTKDDYMKLPKERLAELLAEWDIFDKSMKRDGGFEIPYTPHFPPGTPLCPYGGACVNKFRDCINCPGVIYDGSVKINTTTSTGFNDDMNKEK